MKKSSPHQLAKVLGDLLVSTSEKESAYAWEAGPFQKLIPAGSPELQAKCQVQRASQERKRESQVLFEAKVSGEPSLGSRRRGDLKIQMHGEPAIPRAYDSLFGAPPRVEPCSWIKNLTAKSVGLHILYIVNSFPLYIKEDPEMGILYIPLYCSDIYFLVTFNYIAYCSVVNFVFCTVL